MKTGTRPPYLRRDDWHISSTYTAEEREAEENAEADYIESVAIETPEDEIELVEDEDPFREREYMRYEAEVAQGAAKSEFRMPQTWQEYQFMQEQIAAFASEELLSAAEREQALRHEESLKEFYTQFKVIIFEGWELMNNPGVEAAAEYIVQMRKKLK